MFELKPYSKAVSDKIGHLLKPFANYSRFECIIQRWSSASDIHLQQFLGSFRVNDHGLSPRILELGVQAQGTPTDDYDGCHLIRDRYRWQESIGKWRLFNLSVNHFYWDESGRGLLDLFRGGSGYYSGYGAKATAKFEEFKQLLGCEKTDEVIFFSSLLLREAGWQESLIPGINTFEKLNNLSQFRKQERIAKTAGSTFRDQFGPWFKGLGEDAIFFVQNKTRGYLTMILVTNGFSAQDYVTGQMGYCMIPEKNTPCFPVAFPKDLSYDTLEELLTHSIKYKVRPGTYEFYRISTRDPNYHRFNGLAFRVLRFPSDELYAVFPDMSEHDTHYLSNIKNKPARQTMYKYQIDRLKGHPELLESLDSTKDGLLSDYYEDGTLKSVIHYKAGLKHGTERHYFPTGELKLIQNYVNNRLNGFSVFYHEHGRLNQENRYVHGVLEGDQKTYHPNGRPREFITYEDGSKQGDRVVFWENGEKQLQETYVNGRRHGEQREYYKDGKLKVISYYKKGFAQGPVRRFHPNGQLYQESTCKNGCYDGLFKEYDTYGRLESTREYLNGILLALQSSKPLKKARTVGVPIR